MSVYEGWYALNGGDAKTPPDSRAHPPRGSLFLEFFATSYPQYLALEFIGGVGVAIWGTGASVLIADLSVRENRGRALAVRSMATRLGAIVGPIVGAGIAAGFDLRTIFLFKGFTKVVILAMVFRLVGETRPEAAAEPARPRHGIALDLLGQMFMNRPFLAIAAATFAISMMHQGVFAAILPVYVTREIGLSAPDVGTLITLAAAISLVVSFPNYSSPQRSGPLRRTRRPEGALR